MKKSDFLSFALVISSDESQSKVHFDLQILGENKTGCSAKNIQFFPQTKSSHICQHIFFIHS